MFSRRFKTTLSWLTFLLLSSIPVVAQDLPSDPAGKLLPNRLGEFRAEGSVPESRDVEMQRRLGINSQAARRYVSKDGQRFTVMINATLSDARAYAEFTERRNGARDVREVINDLGIGTASFSYSDGRHNRLSFFKGRVSASLEEFGGESREMRQLLNLARTLAETIDKGEGEIPVLVKHLPDWQAVSPTVHYVLSVETLKGQFKNESVFDAISFAGGAEAVIANYDAQRLVMIEFNTPQLATEYNTRITARIQELRNQGQPVPSAYRRVGNYSVFVFDSPSELAANQLIDQVKYQQVVQWLGKNPYSYREAVAEFTQTTLGVLVSVVKASGLVLLGSLVVGGFFGALLFNRRRALQQGSDAYSDAGGMLRLNLDEVNPQTDPSRLMGRRN